MKIRAVVPVLAALLMTPAVWAQASSAGAPASAKVGVLSVQAAIASTAEGKQAAAELAVAVCTEDDRASKPAKADRRASEQAADRPVNLER